MPYEDNRGRPEAAQPLPHAQEHLHRHHQLPPGGGGGQAEQGLVLDQIQQALGCHHQHVAGIVQILRQLLRRAVRELVAADHGGDALLAHQSPNLVSGTAEQTGGRAGALQNLLHPAAVLLAGEGHHHRLHGA